MTNRRKITRSISGNRIPRIRVVRDRCPTTTPTMSNHRHVRRDRRIRPYPGRAYFSRPGSRENSGWSVRRAIYVVRLCVQILTVFLYYVRGRTFQCTGANYVLGTVTEYRTYRRVKFLKFRQLRTSPRIVRTFFRKKSTKHEIVSITLARRTHRAQWRFNVADHK